MVSTEKVSRMFYFQVGAASDSGAITGACAGYSYWYCSLCWCRYWYWYWWHWWYWRSHWSGTDMGNDTFFRSISESTNSSITSSCEACCWNFSVGALCQPASRLCGVHLSAARSVTWQTSRLEAGSSQLWWWTPSDTFIAASANPPPCSTCHAMKSLHQALLHCGHSLTVNYGQNAQRLSDTFIVASANPQCYAWSQKCWKWLKDDTAYFPNKAPILREDVKYYFNVL